MTIEDSIIVDAPRIKECFLNLECRYEWHKPLYENSLWSLFAGKVLHVAIDEDRVHSGSGSRYGSNGFTLYLPPSKDIVTGQQESLWIGKTEPVEINYD